ncbi:cation:proton antiporter [Phytomonospora sp. NPDC050363]|uniref:cation:proton antiporter n=1 Tax=Phytomonospora sp. NPDC050363 TaxID=3155642 RepID=UPI0033F8CD1B
MTTEQILIGVGLTLVLAVGSQIVADRLQMPALIVLLPVGFTAGILTDDIKPNLLLGDAFEPLVSLAVAIILYDAGLGLDLRGLRGHVRGTVLRLIGFGIPITMAFAAAGSALLLGMSRQAALILGAILVVSGPTVVGPLLKFIRPSERLQRLLIWEGSLIDPIGAILGTVVFTFVVAHSHGHAATRLSGEFLGSIAVGVLGGVVGVALLWLLLVRLRLEETLGTLAQLATVVGVAAACDVIRDDTGLTAAIVMGLVLANVRVFEIAARRPFLETTVRLILGLLFISISSTITPSSLADLALPTLGLVAILVLVTRPLVAWLSSLGTDLSRNERLFTGWMAPRGIVAAATASKFAPALAGAGFAGVGKILPVTFMVIVSTVTLYGLTGGAVARRLRVTRPARTRPLLIGGDPWVLALAQAFRSAGLDVLMWAGLDRQRSAIERDGLELAPGELVAAATGRGAELEGITAVLLLTAEHDFNALAATLLTEGVDGPVYHLAAPTSDHGVVAPYLGGEILFGPGLSGAAITRRIADGGRIVTEAAASAPADAEILFVIRSDGRLVPVTRQHRPEAEPGDTVVLLETEPPRPDG